MNPILVFENLPGADSASLQSSVLRLVQQLGDGATAELVRDVSISSSGTSVRHGLKSIPRGVFITPKSSIHGSIYPHAAADLASVYLTAPRQEVKTSFTGIAGPGACTADIALVNDIRNAPPIKLIHGSAGQAAESDFEATITVNAQIQQLSGANLSSFSYLLTLYRPTTVVCDILLVK